MIQNGFNHNIRYKNLLFHVQTEDYGIQKHLIVTQLFHGGTIITKVQTDYSEFLDLEDIADQIAELMKVQHIKMLKDLVNGKVAIPKAILAGGPEKNDETPTLDLDLQTKNNQKKLENAIMDFLEEQP